MLLVKDSHQLMQNLAAQNGCSAQRSYLAASHLLHKSSTPRAIELTSLHLGDLEGQLMVQRY
jgi:hypothetical protein